MGLVELARVLGAEAANADPLDVSGQGRLDGEVDATELEPAHFAVAPGAEQRAHPRLVRKRAGVDEHAPVRVCQRGEALGALLVLGHDRGAEAEPVERESDGAEREDLRERRFRFHAQETTELSVRRLDDREVPVAIDSRSRPATPQPVGVGDGHADERHALLVREGSDLVRVFVLRGPHPETGKQLHRASVPDLELVPTT